MLQTKCFLTYCLALVAFVVVPARSANVLQQVQVITRHGARTPLTKTGGLVEGGSTLTPNGEKQQYELGLWLRSEYAPELFDQYNSSMARFESSDYDRTLVSAYNLAAGLFPETARDPAGQSLLPNGVPRSNIPVYSVGRTNDIRIRAYDKCPTFQNKLDELYNDATFTGKETSNRDLLTFLAQNPAFQQYAGPGSYVPLSQVWNVYDAINVAKTECTAPSGAPTSRACLELPDPSIHSALTDSQWTSLKNIAHEAEQLKYGRSTAGTLLGGNLLFQIHQRMGGSITGTDDNNDDRRRLSSTSRLVPFYLYSAHYPTILGVLSALGESATDRVIPNYASALIFELYRDSITGAYSVRVRYKDGFDSPTATELRLEPNCNNLQYCPLNSFTSQLQSIGYTNEAGWCTACDNKNADVCLRTQLDNYRCSSCLDNAGAFVATFFGGSMIGVLVTIGVLCLCTKFRRNRVLQRGSSRRRAGHRQMKEGSNPDNIDDQL